MFRCGVSRKGYRVAEVREARTVGTTGSSSEVRRSFCRICHAACPIDVEVRDGRVVKVTGVDDDPLFRGYTCVKGRQLPDQFNSAGRITSALHRTPSGTFEPVASADALDDIAERLRRIIAEHGPRAVATYVGTGGYQNAPLGARRRGLPPGDRVGQLLHVDHDRPADEGHGADAHGHVGGRAEQLRRR